MACLPKLQHHVATNAAASSQLMLIKMCSVGGQLRNQAASEVANLCADGRHSSFSVLRVYSLLCALLQQACMSDPTQTQAI